MGSAGLASGLDARGCCPWGSMQGGADTHVDAVGNHVQARVKFVKPEIIVTSMCEASELDARGC